MAVNKKSLQNLKPPVKGEVRNPHGRPVGSMNSKTIIEKWLSQTEKVKDPNTGEMVEVSIYDSIALAQIKKAKKGDTYAFNALVDRMEGKPKTTVDMNAKIDLSSAQIDFE